MRRRWKQRQQARSNQALPLLLYHSPIRTWYIIHDCNSSSSSACVCSCASSLSVRRCLSGRILGIRVGGNAGSLLAFLSLLFRSLIYPEFDHTIAGSFVPSRRGWSADFFFAQARSHVSLGIVFLKVLLRGKETRKIINKKAHRNDREGTPCFMFIYLFCLDFLFIEIKRKLGCRGVPSLLQKRASVDFGLAVTEIEMDLCRAKSRLALFLCVCFFFFFFGKQSAH